MKLYTLIGAALLGLLLNRPAAAQTPAASPRTQRAPSTGLPSAPPPGAGVPTNATTPTGVVRAETLYPNGVPARNVEGGTQRADQPIRRNPPVVGGQPSKSLRRSRP
ncbi:MAG: hypothetical protein EOO36_13315 [Cytophagaceae bacterium]|nr:MAG: hypothetical protein EOO36_13315 [Cytophagaceae bacterium]